MDTLESKHVSKQINFSLSQGKQTTDKEFSINFGEIPFEIVALFI